MTDTPTITLREKCIHDFYDEHEGFKSTRSNAAWIACPGGRERTFRVEPRYGTVGGGMDVLVEVTDD